MADAGIGVLVPIRTDGDGNVDAAFFGVLATSRDVPTHPRPTAQLRGEGVIASDYEEKDGGTIVHPWDAGYRAGMSVLSVERNTPVHPRPTAKNKGLGNIFEWRRE